MEQITRRRRWIVSSLAVIAMLAAACGGNGEGTTPAPTEAAPADAVAPTDAVVAEDTPPAEPATTETATPAEAEPTITEPDADAAAADELVAPVAAMTCDEGSQPSGDPIVVGGSLSLTGPLAPTAAIHDAVAEVVTQWVNDCGGLLGQPLEWRVLDDQSTPAQAASNYERLLNEGVDFVMGPYGGANILAAAGPIGRAGYVFPTHTNGVPDKEIGEFHFPSWQFGNGAEEDIFATAGVTLYEAYASSGNPPATAFYATAKFPTTESITAATREVFEGEGVETVDSVDYDLGTTDFSSIALRIAAADPDFVYIGGLAADAVNLFDAFAGAGYEPRGIHVALPAPATLPAIGEAAENLTVLSIYENHPPLNETPVAQEFAARFGAAAEENELFGVIETQAAASLGAWQILVTGVAETGEIDNQAVQAFLNDASVDTIAGTLTFDGFNNYGTDVNRITQIQGGERVLVWPEDVAGAELIYQP